MKEIWMVMGFGAGLVAGALLYKHCEDAKKLVNKGEKAVKEEVDALKETVKTTVKQADKGAGNKKAAKSEKPQKSKQQKSNPQQAKA